MSEEPGASHEESVASLLGVLEDPAEGRRRLPKLVGLLDGSDETVRIGAAWALCHVAANLPDTVEYLTRRLVDRIEDEGPATEAELVFEYVAARYPDVVADELEAIESEAESRPRHWPVQGTLARANYHRPEVGKRGVGRTRLAGEGSAPGPRRVYTNDDSVHDRPDRAGDEGAEETEPKDGEDEAADGDGNDGGRGIEDEDGAEEETTDGDDVGGTATESWEPADELAPIVYQSRFDQLTVLSKRRRGRYADVYRTLGVVDGQQLPVGLALYHQPSDDRKAFGEALGEQLERWTGVSDHDNVVPVYDWGVEPQPWAATEYTGQRLASRDRLGLDEALWNASELAGALSHVHENGVVHGGLDPGNVVYYGNVIDEDERQQPLLDNVGLLHVVRDYFDPTARLDPRYAAPEYFDRRFGRIDHATDVYHLGAVLYLLFTGRHPYDGEYGRIRERVVSDPPPRPSDVVDVPSGIDDVVTKAMARQKLRRYETVTHMEQELRGIRTELEADDDS